MTKKAAGPRKIKEIDVPEWRIDYLLTGEEPENPSLGIDFFCFMSGSGNIEFWNELWDRVKDTPYIQNWKKQHGETFAERRLKEEAEEAAERERDRLLHIAATEGLDIIDD
jgi:hypothetical protein